MILIAILLILLLAPSFPLVWCFKRRVTNVKLLLYHFCGATINTQEDDELSTLFINYWSSNDLIYFLEYKSNKLNHDGSLIMKLFYDGYLHLIPKGNELLAKEITERNHSKYKQVTYLLNHFYIHSSFSLNYANFWPLSSKSSTINSFNSLQSSKLSSNSNFPTKTYFAKTVLKSNRSLFLLGTASTQNYFSPSAHKSSVASALVKNVLSFSSNSDNSFCCTVYLAICKANSNPKSNLVLSKDHSKSHIIYQFPLNLLFLSLFLIFVFLPHFQILVMLWFKNAVLIHIHLSLVLSQIPFHKVLFVTQNSQVLRFLILLNYPSQFL